MIGDQAVQRLARRLRLVEVGSVLLIGGDIAVNDVDVAECLDLFRGFPGPRLAIAGNHDVWVEPGHSSWDRYRRLSDIFRRADVHPLEDEPVTINGLGIVGSLGWYDGTFRDAALGIPEDAYRTKISPYPNGGMWGDAMYVHWGMDDLAMVAWQLERLERHLKSLENAKNVLVLMHHVPTKKLLVRPRFLVPKRWRFLNAFLGSERFAQLLGRFSNVRAVINGHIHRADTTAINGIRFASIGGDYDVKQIVTWDGHVFAREMVRR